MTKMTFFAQETDLLHSQQSIAQPSDPEQRVGRLIAGAGVCASVFEGDELF
jgi:hypothetical protein